MPQGVSGGGRKASGLKGGEGREERPVPPMIPIGTGSEEAISKVIHVKIDSLAYQNILWGDYPFRGFTRRLAVEPVGWTAGSWNPSTYTPGSRSLRALPAR